jgi:hypothetical protein
MDLYQMHGRHSVLTSASVLEDDISKSLKPCVLFSEVGWPSISPGDQRHGSEATGVVRLKELAQMMGTNLALLESPFFVLS